MIEADPSAPTDGLFESAAFKEGTASVNGVRLHYVAGGYPERGAIVLIHGFPMTWFHWRKVMPSFAAAGYRVIAPDMRGFGASSKPLDGYEAETIADDLHELLGALGHPSAHVVGHDIGGFVAFAWASKYPDEVTRLTLVDTYVLGASAEPRGDAEPWHFRFHRVSDLPETLIAGKEAEYIDYFFDFAFDRALAAPPAAIAEYRKAFGASGAMRGALGHYRAIPHNRTVNRERLRTPLPMPVLAIGGEAGIGEPMLATAREAASDVRGRLIPRAGHFPAEEQPREFVHRLLEFFDEEARPRVGAALHLVQDQRLAKTEL